LATKGGGKVINVPKGKPELINKNKKKEEKKGLELPSPPGLRIAKKEKT